MSNAHPPVRTVTTPTENLPDEAPTQDAEINSDVDVEPDVEPDAEIGEELQSHVFDDDPEMQLAVSSPQSPTAPSNDPPEVTRSPDKPSSACDPILPGEELPIQPASHKDDEIVIVADGINNGVKADIPLDNTMFGKLRAKPSSTQGLVLGWIAYVQTNGPAAVASILSLVVTIARPLRDTSVDVVTSGMVIGNSPADSVKDISALLAEESLGPIILSGRGMLGRRLRRAYENFWQRLAAGASDAVLYDTDCFDTLISWLEAMAVSRSRALRLAACLASYRIVDGLIDKGNRLRRQLASMQKQLTTEKKKQGFLSEYPKGRSRRTGKKAQSKVSTLSEKGKDLAKKVDDLTANNTELIELSDKVFRNIFILKYRDVCPAIRNASVSALGRWIMSFPDHFLDDVHIKYVGWSLSDKDALVRRSSLETLLRMLKREGFYPNLELFLQRFCNRMVEMSRDKDDAVAVDAIRVLTCLVPGDLIDSHHCESICDMAIEEVHSDIRRAAGNFLAHLITSGNSEGRKPSNVSRSIQKSPKTGRHMSNSVCNTGLNEIPSLTRSCEDIKELIFAITRKGDENSTPHLAVDAVWDYLPALRCWEAFRELLLEGQTLDIPPARNRRASRGRRSQGEDASDSLSANDKAILCEILLATAKEASGNGDAARLKIVERGEFLSSETPGVLLTLLFLPLLPKLINQFQTDTRALIALLELPQYFAFTSFEQEGQEEHLVVLLQRIMDILSRHTRSAGVITACGGTLRTLLLDKNPLRKVTLSALQLGCASASKDFTLQVRADLSKCEPDSVGAALLRVRVLSELIEPNASIYTSVVKLLEYQVEKGDVSELGDEITTDSAHTACALTVWSLSKVRSVLDSSDVSKLRADSLLEMGVVQEVRTHGSAVVNLLNRLCSSRPISISVRVTCLQALMTILTLCRGVEKYVCSKGNFNLSEKEDPDIDMPTQGPDLLGIHNNVSALELGVKSCVFAVVQHQRGIVDHNMSSQGRRRMGSCALSDSEVRDCFASLAQSSFQSVLSNDVSHLPFLGLLLKRKRSESEMFSSEYSTFQLCQKYCQQRQMHSHSLLKDEIRALQDVMKMRPSGETTVELVRELAEALVSSRQNDDFRDGAAENLIQGLADMVLEFQVEEGNVLESVCILCNVGLTLVSRISSKHAVLMLGKMEGIKGVIEGAEICEESDEHTSMVEPFHLSLEAVSKDELPDIPRSFKKDIHYSRKGVKGSRKRKRAVRSSAYTSSAAIENLILRKSSREKKKVDYARLGGFLSEDSIEESEEDDEEEQSSDGGEVEKEPLSTAAEMARKMMAFSHSPRRRTLPRASIGKSNLKKRRTPSRTIPLEVSPKGQVVHKDGTSSPQPIGDPAARRSSRLTPGKRSERLAALKEADIRLERTDMQRHEFVGGKSSLEAVERNGDKSISPVHPEMEVERGLVRSPSVSGERLGVEEEGRSNSPSQMHNLLSSCEESPNLCLNTSNSTPHQSESEHRSLSLKSNEEPINSDTNGESARPAKLSNHDVKSPVRHPPLKRSRVAGEVPVESLRRSTRKSKSADRSADRRSIEGERETVEKVRSDEDKEDTTGNNSLKPAVIRRRKQRRW